MVKVLAITQSVHHIACRVSIQCKGPEQVEFEIFYDPETDQVTLKNHKTTLDIGKDPESKKGSFLVYKGVDVPLEPGAWDVVATKANCTTKLLVLPRRFVSAGDKDGTAELSSQSPPRAPQKCIAKGPRACEDEGCAALNMRLQIQ